MDNTIAMKDAKLELSDGAATPAYTEISVTSLKRTLLRNIQKTITTANVDASGNLQHSDTNLLSGEEVAFETIAYHDGNATPALITALGTIMTANEAEGDDANLTFRVTLPLKTAYVRTYRVELEEGGAIDGLFQLSGKLISQGAKA